MKIFRMARKYRSALAAVVILAGGLTATVSAARAGNNPSTPPTMTLGTYQTSENSSDSFIPISGSGHPNVANSYVAWGQGLPTTFLNSAYSQGATPYLELEPWHQGPSWNASPPSLPAIASNGDASDTNCSLDFNTYATSCATWLADVGKAIASFGHPVVLTFAHEFNVSGQYPWAQGTTGSCGSSPCTPAQWIAAWDEVQSIIDANAGGNAFWMWAPNVDTGGSTTSPAPWWPGASHVDLVGIDGYPSTQYGAQFATFSGEFGQAFADIRNSPVSWSGGIFISETNLSNMDGSGYPTMATFISDLCSADGTGVLEYEDGLPAMTSTQWSELNTALASDCSSGSGSPSPSPSATATDTATTSPSPTGTATPTPTPTATATPTPTSSSTGGGGGTWSCTTSDNNGACPSGGNYNGSLTAGSQQDTEVVQDVSNPSSAFSGQTLQADSAANWQVTATMAAGNTAFISYPDVQDTLTANSGGPVPLADYKSLTTSYATTLPSAGSSDDWAAGYSIWLGDSSTSYLQQVIVWTANHGQVPSGSDLGQVWTDSASGASYEMWENWNTGVITLVPKVNSTSGSFDIYALVEHLTQDGFSWYATGINQVSYGFILASTSGVSKTFAVTNFTLAGTGDGENGAPGA